MNIDILDRKVKIFLKNGMAIEGIVQQWHDEEALVKSFNSDNILIIFNPKENVIMVHVILDAQQPSEEKLDPIKSVPKEPDPQDLELDHYEPDPTLRVKKLAELRQLQIKQHKQDVSRHLTSWKVGAPQISEYPEYYEQSSNAQLSFINRAAKKAGRGAEPDTSGLQGVLGERRKTR
jgi:hypothetical protein